MSLNRSNLAKILIGIFLQFQLFNPAFALDLSFGFGNSSKAPPKWVEEPPSDNTEFIYGIGSGESLEKAQQASLSNISSKLATVISSNITANTSVSQGKVSSQFSENITAKSLDTKLSNFETVKTEAQGGVIYVLTRMSRPAFVKNTLSHLSSLDQELDGNISLARKQSKLQEYLALANAQVKIQEATDLVYLLQATDPNFRSNDYFNKYLGYQKGLDELIYSIRFKIKTLSGDLAPISEMLVSFLGENKLSASANEQKPDVVITVKGKTQKSILFGDYTTQIRLFIQTTDSTGRTFNPQELVVAGSSRVSYENSMVTATALVKSKLEELGAFQSLGLVGH